MLREAPFHFLRHGETGRNLNRRAPKVLDAIRG